MDNRGEKTYNKAIDVWGMIKYNGKLNRTRRWNQEVILIIKEKKFAWEKYKTQIQNMIDKKYVNKMKRWKKAVKQAKKKSCEEFGIELKHDGYNNIKF